jgi:hypothetical protein
VKFLNAPEIQSTQLTHGLLSGLQYSGAELTRGLLSGLQYSGAVCIPIVFNLTSLQNKAVNQYESRQQSFLALTVSLELSAQHNADCKNINITRAVLYRRTGSDIACVLWDVLRYVHGSVVRF